MLLRLENGQSINASLSKTTHLSINMSFFFNAIRLQADTLTDQWNENCSKLEAYHAKYGHCDV